VLLAGLNAPGVTTVIEAQVTRDHTERMLRHFGAEITMTEDAEGRAIALTGQPELHAAEVDIPGDFSSAAFPLAAALTTPDSELTLRNVGVNPHRTGLLTTLSEMGANIELSNERMFAGEPVADIKARTSRLSGVDVPADRVPSMIDEFPVLAIAAAHAKGASAMPGLAELRVKESDRLAAMVEGLASCGVSAEVDGDKLTVQGRGGNAPTGGQVRTHFDHRIAMSFLVLGIAADEAVTVDDGGAIATSFPGFIDLMNGLGAAIGNTDRQPTATSTSGEREPPPKPGEHGS
jgi:3-phosphoshikimate 1-carboxyvinyltransferase